VDETRDDDPPELDPSLALALATADVDLRRLR
jgi:hypothetical protein